MKTLYNCAAIMLAIHNILWLSYLYVINVIPEKNHFFVDLIAS